MKNKVVKFGAFLGLALVGASASASSLANSVRLAPVAVNNQAAGLKTTANDDYTVLWDNPEPLNTAKPKYLTYNSDFIFNSANVSNITLMAKFPDEVWENTIKNGVFYLDFYGDPNWFCVKVTDSSWQAGGKDEDQSKGEYGKDDKEVKSLGDNYYTLTLDKLNNIDRIFDCLNQGQDLLFTGGNYVPLRIYYGDKGEMTNKHYVNVAKRESTAYKNHAHITVDNETAASDKKVTATVNYVNPDSPFEYEPSVKTADDKPVKIEAKSGNSFSFTMPDGDVYVSAEFKDSKGFTAYFFMGNGNHGTHEVSPQLIPYGETVKEPEFPLDDFGFIFLGWFKEGSCANAWNFKEDKITCDTTLYAKWREILSLEVVTDGAKTEYEVGDDLDLANLKVNLRYNTKGEYEEGEPELSSPLTFDVNQSMVKGYDKYKSGTQSVNVCFNGVERSFKVTVADFDVALKSKPTKLEYTVGQALDLAGAKLTLTSKGSTHKTADIDVTPEMVSGFDNKKLGTQTLTVSLNGKTFTFDITVSESTSGGISVGALVGGIIGAAVVGAGIAVAVTLLIKKKKPAAK